MLIEILECAKQGVNDAARLRREAMTQILRGPCRNPQVMLECLQQFEDKKRAYNAEFATHLPEDFEEDLLRQQQENAKISDDADMKALLRKLYEVSNRGGEPLDISRLSTGICCQYGEVRPHKKCQGASRCDA